MPISEGRALRINGRNGSGKTTILKILAGCYIVSGVKPLKSCVWVPSEPMLLAGMKVKDQLAFYQILGEGSTIWLTGYRDKSISQLSKGQKQLLHLAKLFYTSAQIWLLDEPFTALDKHHTQQFSDMMDNHLSQGGSVVYSSHEVNRQQDEVLCLDAG